MNRTNPFKRSIAMVAAIQAIMANLPPTLQRGAIDALGPYKSRGKGRGTPSKQFNSTNAFHRYVEGRAYGVDYGKRECARRVRQMQAAAH